MPKASRHQIRECLLQSLYGRSVLGEDFDISEFVESYSDLLGHHGSEASAYFSETFSGIVSHEAQLCAVVRKYAPKFEIPMMPIVNLLPVFIAAYEMLYLECDKVPEKVSINEAIELAKSFSDDSAKNLVNGVLNSLKNDREALKAELANSTDLPKFGLF